MCLIACASALASMCGVAPGRSTSVEVVQTMGPFGSAYARALASGRIAGALRGIASHCYFVSPDEISAFHGRDPRLDQIVAECSPGLAPMPTSEMVISAMRDWATTVAVWNLALDPSGGPVQVPNIGCRACSALVTVERRSGA